MRVAILTGGGDAPGMNAFVRAAVRMCLNLGIEPIGVLNAYDGLIDGAYRPLSAADVSDIIDRGGTIINCGRSARFRTPEGQQQAIDQMRAASIDGLIVCGGDGSLTGALTLHQQGVKVVGAPGSIDNDVSHTDMAIGVDTALNTIVEAIDRLRDTANSHHRCFVIEVMGRHSGYLAINAGLAAGVDYVLVPEVDSSFDDVMEHIEHFWHEGRMHYLIVVAEGSKLRAEAVARQIDASDNLFEARLTVLGHLVRGGTPSAFDRILAARLGSEAVRLLHRGVSGVMVGGQGTTFAAAPLADVVRDRRRVNTAVRDLAIALAHGPGLDAGRHT